MTIDGKQISAEILTRVAAYTAEHPLSLALFITQVDSVTDGYTRRKRALGEFAGVSVSEHRLPAMSTTDEVVAAVGRLVQDHDGVVVQLPLAPHVDPVRVLNNVPFEKDPDMLSDAAFFAFLEHATEFLPPVVGAVAEVLSLRAVPVRGARAVVVGDGKLVGKPVATWLRREGADVSVVTAESGDVAGETHGADIIVTGAGSPGLITSDMIKEGVVLLDAGTSESRGKVVGDIDPACAEKAALFTPVPGGIGPIAVAKLYENLMKLHSGMGAL